jgi:hypothetical protein
MLDTPQIAKTTNQLTAVIRLTISSGGDPECHGSEHCRAEWPPSPLRAITAAGPWFTPT